MRWTLFGFIAYLLLLTLALCVSNPFAAAGAYQGELQRLFERFVAPAAHFLAFFPLGWLAMAIRSKVSSAARMGLLVSYAFATEAAQSLMPDRTPQWPDIAQNLAGIAAGAAAWWMINKAIRRDAA